jgi:hypothetical protein
MNKKTWVIIGASALGLYFLLRNGGKGTSVMKGDGNVDTKMGFDGTRAKNLVPDVYGRGVGKDVYMNLNGVGSTLMGNSDVANMGGQSTISICAACRDSVKSNRYRIDLPKIL